MEHTITFAIEELQTHEPESIPWTCEDWIDILDEQSTSYKHDDEETTLSLFYNTHCTVKELMMICEYYGLAKELRANKCNKTHIVTVLVGFETNISNTDIVCRRRNMWFFMKELQKDKFMKKFLLW